MIKAQVENIFKKSGALLEGHFKLSSGLHSDKYIQCALVLQVPSVAQKLAKELALKFKKTQITCVIGPALGGLIIGHEVARALKVKSIFTERKDGEMLMRRGFSLSRDDRVLIVEDVVTTGKSTKEVIKVVKQKGAKVVAIGSLVNRTGGKRIFNVPYKALIQFNVRTYKPNNCPLCRAKKPLTKPGSRS